VTKINPKYPMILAGYGVACFIAAVIMSFDTTAVASQWLPASGGKFGPITTEESNEVVTVELRQSLGLMKWSSVDVDVLDERGNYLFAFGDEFWHEAGRDSDGRWEEAKDKYSLSITFPDAGSYFLNVAGQGNTPETQAPQIYVSAVRELGSSLALTWLGGIALCIAAFMIYLNVKDN
jgi:hypothetical protein